MFYHTAVAQVVNTGAGQAKDGVYYITAGEFLHESYLTGMDYNTYARQQMETGWIKVGGLQGRQRVYDVIVLLKNQDQHQIKLSLAYDYNETYSQSVTFTESITGVYPEELSIQPSNQQAIAIKLKIEDITPSPLGSTKRGFDILGIAFQVAAKDGIQKLDATNKG